MNFKSASVIEQITWQMRLADYPRAQNRALVAALFDGAPPYTPEEERENNVVVNVNFLESTKLAHDARQQFANAVQKPGKFFTARLDSGPTHRRQEWGTIVTNQINRVMKSCPHYYESLRSRWALLVLHGIAPSVWETSQYWCPDTMGVEDIMIPSGTYLNLKNLPFFAVYRAYTAFQLYQLTHGPRRDPRWNMPVVDSAIKWANDQAAQLNGSTWPEVWAPDKMEQRMKEDSGLYASDAVPIISAWDFYWWAEEDKIQGWRRAIVLDAYGQPGVGGLLPNKPSATDKNIIGGSNQFLYKPGKARNACSIREIVNFQFADLSAVAPFRYHAVRSLGFMLYAVCHLQNRLRCKFNEAVLEGLMMYMRVKSMDDVERALKVNLISRGIIDETVQFLPPQERWQVNEELVALGLAQNQAIINENSASMVQNSNYSKPDVEKTAFQVRAELNATTALISAALLQAYQYQNFEYNEIFRRFCIKNSSDPDVRKFRLGCLRAGVPEEFLDPSMWELEPERVMGSGNKTLELATAQTLMQWRPLYAPNAQQEILRVATLAVTDDPGLAVALVPDNPAATTDSKNDAMVSMGTLMLGLPVKFSDRSNRIEVTETLLAEMALLIKKMMARPNKMATPQELDGLQMVAGTINEQIQFIAQDKNERERAKEYANALKDLTNEVKGFAQRLAQAMKQAQQANGANGNGEAQMEMAKEKIKLQGMQLQAQTKAKNMRESHAQRTAERQVSFENEEKRRQQEHELEMRRKGVETAQELQAEDVRTAGEIQRERAKTEAQIQNDRENTPEAE